MKTKRDNKATLNSALDHWHDLKSEAGLAYKREASD